MTDLQDLEKLVTALRTVDTSRLMELLAAAPPQAASETRGRELDLEVEARHLREVTLLEISLTPSNERGELLLKLRDIITTHFPDLSLDIIGEEEEVVEQLALDVSAQPHGVQARLAHRTDHSDEHPDALALGEIIEFDSGTTPLHNINEQIAIAAAMGTRFGYTMTLREKRQLGLRLLRKWLLFSTVFSFAQGASAFDVSFLNPFAPAPVPEPTAWEYFVCGFWAMRSQLIALYTYVVTASGENQVWYSSDEYDVALLFDSPFAPLVLALVAFFALVGFVVVSRFVLQLVWRLVTSILKAFGHTASVLASARFTAAWYWKGKRISGGKDLVECSINAWSPTVEMAIVGSEFKTTKAPRGVIAFLKKEEATSEYRQYGFGFRTGSHLVTVMHVWDNLMKAPGATYVVPVVGTDKAKFDASRIQVLDQDSMVDLVDRYGDSIDVPDLSFSLDCVIFSMSEKFWSTMGVKSVALGDAVDDAPVDGYGYFPPELKRSTGLVISSKDPLRIHYTASTRDGSSGLPIMMGTKCVALHVGTTGVNNRGLASTIIQLIINQAENIVLEGSGDVIFRDRKGVFRNRNGYEVDVAQTDFGFMLIDARGRRRALPRDAILDYEEALERLDAGKGRMLEAATIPPIVPVPPGSIVEYDDQDSIPPVAIRPVSPRMSGVRNTSLAKCAVRETRVTTPKFKGYDNTVKNLLDLSVAKDLGFDPDLYDFPRGVLEEATTKSFWMHVERHAASTVRAVEPPEDVTRAAIRYCTRQLAPASFVMTKDPLSDERLSTIINSSLIQGSKSPGRFFMSQGFATNADVIAHYGVEGLAKLVRELGEPSDINVFPKIEPHKRSKIDSGMIRLISGVDLRETILCQAYFCDFNEKLAKKFMQLPTMIGWSPVAVGHGDYFAETFKKAKRLLKSDVESLDWSAYLKPYIESVITIIVASAVPARAMSQGDADRWKAEAAAVLRRQFTMPFVLPDGTRVMRLDLGIMSSGSGVTLTFNTIMTMFLDAVAKLLMGYSTDQLVTHFKTKFGGDDNVQTIPDDFDEKKYKAAFSSLGPNLHEVEVYDGFNGVEFFSWKFESTPLGVTWLPTRWTKHIQALMATPLRDLKQALCSHMTNWAHDAERYRFFENVWQSLASSDASVSLDYPRRADILNRLAGLEVAPSHR